MEFPGRKDVWNAVPATFQALHHFLPRMTLERRSVEWWSL